MENITEDYLLDKKIKMFQKKDGYKTSSDAVLLSAALSEAEKGTRILDVGSGVGGVSLCLAHRLKDADIIGFEIQGELVELSNMSAKENGFEHLKYVACDIRSKTVPEPFGSFDFVLTNPPYFEGGSKSPNKSKALAHSQEGICLEDWLRFCLKMLKPFGTLCLIHRAEALEEILHILHNKAGDISVLPIYSKKGENAKRIIIKAKKDSKSPLKILPPFVMHEANGYTLEAEAVLRGGKPLF